jgi:uncharacterized protein YceH (UPF0502 family)
MLPRQEGRKEPRYAHLFCGEPEESSQPATDPGQTSTAGTSRLEALELEVDELKSALGVLEDRFETFRKQFE